MVFLVSRYHHHGREIPNSKTAATYSEIVIVPYLPETCFFNLLVFNPNFSSSNFVHIYSYFIPEIPILVCVFLSSFYLHVTYSYFLICNTKIGIVICICMLFSYFLVLPDIVIRLLF